MALLIRLDRSEKVLRSVGDAPNGIVVAAASDERGFMLGVDAGWQPTQDTGAVEYAGAWDEKFTPLEADEVVAACESQTELAAIWQIPLLLASETVKGIVVTGPHPEAGESLRGVAAFCDKVFEALRDAGHVPERPE